jgi:hypothetical protein
MNHLGYWLAVNMLIVRIAVKISDRLTYHLSLLTIRRSCLNETWYQREEIKDQIDPFVVLVVYVVPT